MIHVLTVATRKNYPLQCWYQSLLEAGFDSTCIHILGIDEKWQGFAWRTQKYIARLRELHKQNNNNIYILSDGEDVFFLGSPREFKQQWMTATDGGKRPLFCAEFKQLVGRFMCPEERKLSEDILTVRNNNRSGWNAVNAGLCIGTFDQLEPLLMQNAHMEDDQEGMQMIALAKPDMLQVDSHCRCFGLVRANYTRLSSFDTLPKEWAFNPKSRRLIFSPSGLEPLALHFAGKVPMYYIVFLRLSDRTEMANQMKLRLQDFVTDMEFYAKQNFQVMGTKIILFALAISIALAVGYYACLRENRRK